MKNFFTEVCLIALALNFVCQEILTNLCQEIFTKTHFTIT